MTVIGEKTYERFIDTEDSSIQYKKVINLLNGLFFFIALFLAQAVFFDAAVPFFLPLWCIVRARYEGFKTAVLIGGVIGALNIGMGQAVILGVEIMLVECISRFRYWRLSPAIVIGITMLFVQAVWQTVSYGGMPPFLVQLYVFYEIFFAVIMLLFMNHFFVPLHEFWTKKWSAERVGAGLLIMAVMITGMESTSIAYFALTPIALHLLICLAAAIGGISASVIVAVVVGIFVGVAQLSFSGMLALYAVTGVIVGACKGLGRFTLAASSLLPSVFFFLYDATLPLDSVYFVSILTATMVFVLLPQRYLDAGKSIYALQTSRSNQQEHEMTALATNHLIQFQQFVYFMKDLVFDRFTTVRHTQEREQIEPLSICASCFRFDRCWDSGQNEMSQSISQWLMMKKSSKPLEVVRAEEQLKMKCVKSAKLIEELEAKLHKEHLNGQFYHGKKMVALQLRDLSHHLEQLLDDMKSGSTSYATDQHIIDHLEQHGVACFQINWINNVVGERDVIFYVVCEEDETILMQQMGHILSELFDEPLIGQEVMKQPFPFSHVQMRFQSAVRYKLEYDIYKRTKNGVQVSGDAHAVFPVHAGLTAIMLSDGMGSNREAQRESTRLIQMMRDCLNYNMDPETAMHTMHYVLSLKHDADMYATIDFALVDLQVGTLWCWKAGGMTTYILRGPKLFKIESKTAPIGFMPVFTIETETIQVLAEDIIIMVSDGIFTSSEDWAKQEALFLQLIRQCIKKGAALNVILYDVMAQYKQVYKMDDDCTVMLFQLTHLNPQWSVFRPNSYQLS